MSKGLEALAAFLFFSAGGFILGFTFALGWKLALLLFN